MRHFRKVGEIDVGPLRQAVADHSAIFGAVSWREKSPGSPHPDTETLYLRMPPEITLETVFHGLDVIDLPLMRVQAFADAVREVSGVTGGIAARAIIVKLKPGGQIARHIDQGAYAEATHRWHIAIATNKGASLTAGHDEEFEVCWMKPGEVWWFDKHAPHLGSNLGETDRIHLIVDTYR